MSAVPTPEFLSELSERVGAVMGLHFPPNRWPDLERGIRAAAAEFGYHSAEACSEWLLSSSLSKRHVEILASHLTVGETYFFRESKALEILQQQILPDLIRSARNADRCLRIWSAGCCTGEEPYSLAILLDQVLPDLVEWKITLLATDINPRFLQKAAQGVYGKWSFRGAPAWLRERYFIPRNPARFELLPRIRRMVTFEYLNLAEDAFPSLLNNTNGMDLIFCRNVLMYFAPERAKDVAGKLHRCLKDGGWLVVSPSEASAEVFSAFLPVHFPEATLYRRDGEGSGRKEAAFSSGLEESAARWLPAVAPGPLPKAEPISFPGVPESSPADLEKPPSGGTEACRCEKVVMLFEQGRYAQAKHEAIELLSREPAEAHALALLARICANEGRLSEALDWCDRAIAADKLCPSHHYLRALILQEQGALEEAEAALKRTLYLDPQFALAHFALGNLAGHLGEQKESQRHYANALALLGAYRPEEILPESEGMTVGRVAEIIHANTDDGGGS